MHNEKSEEFSIQPPRTPFFPQENINHLGLDIVSPKRSKTFPSVLGGDGGLLIMLHLKLTGFRATWFLNHFPSAGVTWEPRWWILKPGLGPEVVLFQLGNWGKVELPGPTTVVFPRAESWPGLKLLRFGTLQVSYENWVNELSTAFWTLLKVVRASWG